MNFLKSASKLVFMMLGSTACIAFLTNRLEAKDFMVLTMAAFTYYFTKKKEEGK